MKGKILKGFGILMIFIAFNGCSLFKSKEKPVSEWMKIIEKRLKQGVSAEVSEDYKTLGNVDSFLGNIGIVDKRTTLRAGWEIDTFDITGDRKPDIILYIKSDEVHPLSIIAVYDNTMKLLFTDKGYIQAKIVRPRYEEKGWIYYTKIVGNLATHYFVGPYLGECKTLFTIKESYKPLPLNFTVDIFSDRHMRFNFYLSGNVVSGYVIQHDGQFRPLTGNLFYRFDTGEYRAYLVSFPYLKEFLTNSYITTISPIVLLSPDSSRFIYVKEDTVKAFVVKTLASISLLPINGEVVSHLWSPNGKILVLKTREMKHSHYYLIYPDGGMSSRELDMDNVFYKAGTVVGSPVKYTLYPEIDSWIRSMEWVDPLKLAFIIDYQVGYPGKVIARNRIRVVVDGMSGFPLEAAIVGGGKPLVPLYKLTGKPWIDETGTIVKYMFYSNGKFEWESLNSDARGFGRYEVVNKKMLRLIYKYEIRDLGTKVDTFHILRVEYFKIRQDKNGNTYLLTEDNVRLYQQQ